MKKLIFLGLCTLFFMSSILLIHAQQSIPSQQNIAHIDLASLVLPNFKGTQSLKGLITISVNKSDALLTRTSTGLSFVKTAYPHKNQLWWIIQDEIHNGFSLSSVTDGSQWLAIQNSNGTPELQLITNDVTSIHPTYNLEYLDKKYFFEFESSIIQSGQALFKSIRSKDALPNDPDIYWHLKNKQQSPEQWKIEGTTLTNTSNTEDFIFNYNILKSFDNNYIPIPFYDSAYHKKDPLFNNKTATRLSLLSNPPIAKYDNSAVVGSGDIIILNKEEPIKTFKIVFEEGSIAEIGLLDYSNSKFTQNVLQSPGARRPIAGIELNEDGTIYLFNKGTTKETSFLKNEPIYLWYHWGKMHAEQNNQVVTLTGVPTPVLLNGDDGNYGRLLSMVRKGAVQLSYKPKNIIISSEKFGNQPAPENYITDPQFSFSPEANTPVNLFDWREKTYIMRYKVDGEVRTERALSPFYGIGEKFAGISAKHLADGTYVGGEDYSPLDGWELIKMDFGYDEKNQPKPDIYLLNEPYMILYNRFSGKLRVFIYIKNDTTSNILEISIVDTKTNTISGVYGKPRLWSSYLQGYALDNPNLNTGSYAKSIPLNSNTSSEFFYADFIFNYDPCTCFFESNLEIKVKKMTRGTLKIVGRTLGGSIPAGAPEYTGFMKNSDNFLNSTLDTPYGKQAQTLGDISFKNFDDWGAKEWSNETKFVLPGKKVQDWEREALLLEYQGTSVMSSGDFLSGAGKVIKTIGKTANGLPFIGKLGLGDAADAVGEGMDAAGTTMKGSGRSMKAAALKMRLDNLKDQEDKTIPLKFPDPQPSVVFSELSATGTLEIVNPIFEGLIITTPGSKNAEQAPVESSNGSKGAFPLYNESIGIFNMMYTPSMAVSVVKNEYSDVGAYLRIKERPYIVTNINKTRGFEGGFFMASIVVTTYDTKGVATSSNRSKTKTIRKKLPMSLDISSLIDHNTLNKNIKSLSSATNASIAKNIKEKWLTINYEIEYYGYSGLAESGKQNGEMIRQSYTTNLDVSYTTTTDTDLPKKAKEEGESKFKEYNGADNPTWGDAYFIGKDTPGFETKMLKFCTNTVPHVSVRNMIASKEQTTDRDKNTTTSGSLAEEQIVTEVKKFGLSVYPNPSKKEFNIQYSALQKGKVKITITDLNGRLIISHTDFANSTGKKKEARINLQNLSGVYVLKIQFENGETHTTKLIKEN
ncbi:putative secreted protein (Por secretion system target) [Aquimarina sp. MAR_2010_214]|uniref:T9SS type A sorting domain-containing protein n=1 Tax=Aquimarina sp. MAR_2010_214 TaxID=1250026 RepID=UPI000C6FF69E|nr:T9SS type A sorting domain-containing protein [Aquimarina sp. MAR_2010_214]PKV52272.1 putative secreted protein (Por secretion system target) [Aquimarina sp. MAR_2010_214]